MGNLSSIDFYRAALQRQRDFHSGIRFWSRIAMVTPGPFVFLYGAGIGPELAKEYYAPILIFVAGIIAAIPLNLRRARKFQRQIDELDALRKEPI
jgi:hypothetical protein